MAEGEYHTGAAVSWLMKFNCSVCGVEKKQTNNWWMASQEAGTFVIEPWGQGCELAEFHLCGETCAMKTFSKYMQSHSTKPVVAGEAK